MTRARQLPLTLDDETFGERLHRAFRRNRAATGETWSRLAERVSQVRPTSEASMIRLVDLDDVPKTNSGRLLAYMVVLALGYKPEDFGLSEANVPLAGYDLKRVADLLKRRSECSSRAA